MMNFFWSYQQLQQLYTSIKYGYLYNWWAATNPAIIKYGYLYNGISVLDSRNIANEGWHIPSSTELQTLSTYLGGSSVAGGKLKETGITKWTSPNTGATNEVGFNAVPSGRRIGTTGLFSDINTLCKLGTATFLTPQIAITLSYNSASFTTSTGSTIDKDGYSLRLTKDLTTLTHGQTGTYTGNDGKVYQTICIGTQEWLSENLMETKYRNGDAIPEVTVNATWAALTTGARCSYNNTLSNAGTGNAITSSDDWAVPSYAQWDVLIAYLGGNTSLWGYVGVGAKMKTTGLNYWETPNTGATNSTRFNFNGNGIRSGASGQFSNLKLYGTVWRNVYNTSYTNFWMSSDSADANTGTADPKNGYGIRLMYVGSGTPTNYVGNDGKIYRIVQIGTQWWLADNLAETLYRDGSTIPVVTDNTAWAALTTGARCVYNNDESNM